VSAHALPTRKTNPQFERFGGREAVVRLVDAFYDAMDTRPEAATIRALHDADLTETKAVLVRYLDEWLAGPLLFAPERGAPALRRRHERFTVDDAARDAWMLCMRQALAQTCPDVALRGELDAAFLEVADLMRNVPG
jgi:hemoglobin